MKKILLVVWPSLIFSVLPIDAGEIPRQPAFSNDRRDTTPHWGVSRDEITSSWNLKKGLDGHHVALAAADIHRRSSPRGIEWPVSTHHGHVKRENGKILNGKPDTNSSWVRANSLDETVGEESDTLRTTPHNYILKRHFSTSQSRNPIRIRTQIFTQPRDTI